MAVTKFIVVTVPSNDTETVDFGNHVNAASASVNGFYVTFGDDDHHIKTINVTSSIKSINDSVVTVGANCYVEDDSGNKGDGTVDVLVTATVESS